MILKKESINKIKEIYSKNQEKIIFFTMKKTGCSGFEYVIELIKNNENENVIFENHEEIIIGIDEKFKEIFDKTILDYKIESLESKFLFTNEVIEDYCGCGKSFTLKNKR